MAIAASCCSHSRSMVRAGEAAYEQQPFARGSDGVHGFRAACDEIQRVRHAKRAGDAPGRHFADAVAGNHAPAGHRVSQRHCGGQCLQ